MNKSQIGKIASSSFLYHLPAEKIAQQPLKKRGSSKLLVYKNGQVAHNVFDQLPTLLPKNSHLFFNNTKVIPARLSFRKSTGAIIEIFLLNPVKPAKDINLVMEATSECEWQVMVGNLKKWKIGQPLVLPLQVEGKSIEFIAELVDRDLKIVKFHWDNPELSFATIIDVLGKMPLPPYIRREADIEDKNRYQTVYSHQAGAVAAPTAGLHFSTNLLDELITQGHQSDYLTLHVSAGTFKPVTSENVVDHPMHEEQIVISKKNLENILEATNKIIAVGTTSMRTLESIFWLGVKLVNKEKFNFHIEKLMPYDDAKPLPTLKEAITAIINYMDERELTTLTGSTEIMIFPGYKFQVCDGLITNFHLPGSTLIMLVAAFVGDRWKQIYDTAIDNDYRFLSYGDSSLLLPHQ